MKPFVPPHVPPAPASRVQTMIATLLVHQEAIERYAVGRVELHFHRDERGQDAIKVVMTTNLRE